MLNKKQQKKIGIKGKTKQYDVGYRDTPNSEAVLTAKEKKKAKAALNDISNALKMSAGGDVKKKKPMNAGMKSLKKEAPEVAAKMGYMYGGVAKKPDMKSMGMAYGGMAKKKKMGYAHGGLACGASNGPSQAGTRKIKTS